ncbi:uncharacterized protein LOC113232244 [Hyposmocoma kahamanoa]|uniref:uncharacterized protein LOC113232244 n=1 Tax=Hyposmocoma kahamanoa TaxID=1477025 RepID=UPI000E6D8C42|nr:uncharacterized protein LOC113232244 [Hyposmocoma kahamanoa]
MVKISGDYDKVDHFWCQNIIDKEGENPKVFFSKADFSEYENPKEAIAIVHTKHLYGNNTPWNCTLLTRKDAQIHKNNLYVYDNASYSKIEWKAAVHIVEETPENMLLFKMKDDNTGCEIEKPAFSFTIKEDSTITVKISNANTNFYKFWCERDTNSTSNTKVLEVNLTLYFVYPSYAIAVIPVHSLHGEFKCFIATTAYFLDTNKIIPTTYEKVCEARLELIGSQH